MKILNLYSGIGGNRRLWGDSHEITAVEYIPEIAKVYQDFFPNDKVVIADAHQYLLDHYKEFDFIWSSPPCPTHSDIRRCSVHAGKVEAKYPDMKLYEEIILLQNFSKPTTKWVVENVVSYYKPLITPYEVGKHYWWSNFYIREIGKKSRAHTLNWHDIGKIKGIDLENYKIKDKRKILRNCVEPETGLWVFQEAFKNNQTLL